MRESCQLLPSLEMLFGPVWPWGLSLPVCKMGLTAIWKSYRPRALGTRQMPQGPPSLPHAIPLSLPGHPAGCCSYLVSSFGSEGACPPRGRRAATGRVAHASGQPGPGGRTGLPVRPDGPAATRWRRGGRGGCSGRAGRIRGARGRSRRQGPAVCPGAGKPGRVRASAEPGRGGRDEAARRGRRVNPLAAGAQWGWRGSPRQEPGGGFVPKGALRRRSRTQDGPATRHRYGPHATHSGTDARTPGDPPPAPSVPLPAWDFLFLLSPFLVSPEPQSDQHLVNSPLKGRRPGLCFLQPYLQDGSSWSHFNPVGAKYLRLPNPLPTENDHNNYNTVIF